MKYRFCFLSSAVFALMLLSCFTFASEIVTILDENVDDVIKYITSGNGKPDKSTDDKFKGNEALKIGVDGGDGQNFNPNAPDWKFEIVEKPSTSNEFRYITFAWRKDGGEGIQLQLHGNPDTWGHRYHGGANVKNWNPSIQVSKKIPAKWEVHTRDLFKDWKKFQLTGIAFTAWDGKAGYWDHVYLHQGESLASVDSKGKITAIWADLKRR